MSRETDDYYLNHYHKNLGYKPAPVKPTANNSRAVRTCCICRRPVADEQEYRDPYPVNKTKSAVCCVPCYRLTVVPFRVASIQGRMIHDNTILRPNDRYPNEDLDRVLNNIRDCYD